MTERASTSIEARVDAPGGALGTVTAGRGAIEIAFPATADVRRIRTEDIAEVTRRGDRVELALQRGAPLVLISPRAEELDAMLVRACCTLPELTRALRSLGSSRAGTRAAAQREFFAPLLDARRRAEESVARADIVSAFDPDALTRAFERFLTTAARHTPDQRPAARRAYAAYAEDVATPLVRSLAEVRRTREAAGAPPPDARIASWLRWTQALRHLFEAADRCWTALDRSGLAAPRGTTPE